MSSDSERSIHDRTIQTLYSVGLRLEHGMAMVHEAPDDAKAIIDGAIGSLTIVIEDLRQRIYELSSS